MPQRANRLLWEWMQERLCVKRCLPEQMPEASQRMVHQGDDSCASVAAQPGTLCGSAPSPMLSAGERFDLCSPQFYSSFLPGSRRHFRCFPCVLHPVVHCWCATGTGSTRRTLPAHADAARSHIPLSGDARHAVHAGPPHRTRASPRAM